MFPPHTPGGVAFWTPTTPPTDYWPESPWGGGGGGIGGGVRQGRMGGGLGGAWGGGALREGQFGGGGPGGAIWGGEGRVQVGQFGVLGGCDLIKKQTIWGVGGGGRGRKA